MKKNQTTDYLVLAVAPSTRGFGFAVLEGGANLVDWGTKPAKGNKQLQFLEKLERLIAQYEPDVLVLEDVLAKGSWRAKRIQKLVRQIIKLGQCHRIEVVLLPRAQVRRCFFPDGGGTKHGVAEMIAAQFQDELGHCLPPRRRAWMSEDRRMDIFDAVALALVCNRL